ncbi:MAG: ATP-binding protein [archaeon]
MERKFSDLFKRMKPLGKKNKAGFSFVKDYLDKDQLKDFRYLLKKGMIGVSFKNMGLSRDFFPEVSWPQIDLATDDNEVRVLVNAWNLKIEEKAKHSAFRKFAKVAEEKIRALIAPNIVGLDDAKEGALLQLFALDPVHILLLGDPGTGKTEILRAVHELAPISTYGLGSGTTGVGLTVAKEGNEIHKGLLPLADEGIACIDELNLLKKEDRGSLYNAMEKGFITYDKGKTHMQFDARIRLLATANPEGDRFVGKAISLLKKQMPFDPALLSRFHLIFFIRRPSTEAFVRIARKIVSAEKFKKHHPDYQFVKEFVAFAEHLNVEFDKSFQSQIVDFVESIKKDEEKFLIDITPRFVVGIIRLTQASARMRLSAKVTEQDVDKVLKLVKESVYFR